jgi:hypothetical protein
MAFTLARQIESEHFLYCILGAYGELKNADKIDIRPLAPLVDLLVAVKDQFIDWSPGKL